MQNSEATRPSPHSRQQLHRLERTDNRIRAFLAAVKPGGDPLDEWTRGRSVIERMANHSHGCGEPRLALTLEECADVLSFLEGSEPTDPKAFYDGWAIPSPHIGMMFVLRAVRDRLVRRGRALEQRMEVANA